MSSGAGVQGVGKLPFSSFGAAHQSGTACEDSMRAVVVVLELSSPSVAVKVMLNCFHTPAFNEQVPRDPSPTLVLCVNLCAVNGTSLSSSVFTYTDAVYFSPATSVSAMSANFI